MNERYWLYISSTEENVLICDRKYSVRTGLPYVEIVLEYKTTCTGKKLNIISNVTEGSRLDHLILSKHDMWYSSLMLVLSGFLLNKLSQRIGFDRKRRTCKRYSMNFAPYIMCCNLKNIDRRLSIYMYFWILVSTRIHLNW